MPLGKRTDFGDSRYTGVAITYAHDVGEAMQEYLLCGFDFVVAPLVHGDHKEPALRRPDGDTAPPREREELMLQSAQFGGQIVGRTSSWIDPDSSDPVFAKRSSQALSQELSWAAFLGLQAVIVTPNPKATSIVNLAQIINKAVAGLTHMAIWISLPLTAAAAAAGEGALNTSSSSKDSWEIWHQLFTLCDYSSLLGVSLELAPDVPSGPSLSRWLGQPLKALQLPTACFTTNKRGYPVLGKHHQDLANTAMTYGVQIILTGECRHRVAPTPAAPPQPPAPPKPAAATAATDSSSATPSSSSTSSQQQPPAKRSQSAVSSSAPAAAVNGTGTAAAGGDDPLLPFAVVNPGESHPLRPYWEYLCYIFRRLAAPELQDLMELNYRDYLQAPLQPLQDDLESQTYETFEKDITKYTTYEEAVKRALLDRVPEAEAETKTTVVMVVGAGRGPLVHASLRAAAAAGRKIKVYAVEKNPCAVVHIQTMVAREGLQDQVTIVHADMRAWQAPEAADILVSELLGSFGDNELSPECLDGAQRFLAPDGISIPSSYTSYLAPLTSWKLFDAVRAYKDLEHFETPYVVKPFRCCILADPQPVFTFHHPNRDAPIDNDRSITLTFERKATEGSGIIHGLVGYFESVLYKDVTLNTHPPTHTHNMFSWFPIFFPFKEPMYVAAGRPITVNMWRRGTAHKVWYEWALSQPTVTNLHNPGGRSYWVGL